MKHLMPENSEPKLFRTPSHPDVRGTVRVIYHVPDDAHPPLPIKNIAQVLCTSSREGVLRGMHWQYPRLMGKFVHCVHGSIQDVLVDLREGSFGTVHSFMLHDSGVGLWVPRGFAHGFFVLEGPSTVVYFCDEVHIPSQAKRIRWDSIPNANKVWEPGHKLVSNEDRAARTLSVFYDTIPMSEINGGS